MKRLTIILSIASLFAAASCSDRISVPEITSGYQDLHFSTEGGTEKVAVEGKGLTSWSAFATGSWIGLVPDNAAGTLTINVARTEDIDAKEGEIIIYTQNEEVKKIRVSQDGNGIIYDRSSAKIMGIRGKVRTMDFWFDPIHMWEVQPGFFYNLAFDQNGMLTHYEFRYKAGIIVDFAIDVTYDAQNRVKQIHGTTSDTNEDYYPSEYTYDFTYGSHGKYVCLENLFAPADTWGCLAFTRAWLPASLKDLVEVRLSSSYFESYQPLEKDEDGNVTKGVDHVELFFAEYSEEEEWKWQAKYRAYFTIKNEDGTEAYNPQGTEYHLNKYKFTGNYTTTMLYDTQFVGITIPVTSTFDIDQRNGLIYSQEIRNDEVFVGRPLLRKAFYPDFRNSLFAFEDDLGTYYRMSVEYNDRYDVEHIYNGSTTADAKFGYEYDSNGNWIALELDTNKKPDTEIPNRREIKYYR